MVAWSVRHDGRPRGQEGRTSTACTSRTRWVRVARTGMAKLRVYDVARKYACHVLEDCAQAHGARYKGRMVGSMEVDTILNASTVEFRM